MINKLQGDLFKFSYDSLSYKSKLVNHKKELLFRSYSHSLEQYSYSLDNAKYRLLDSYQRKSAQWDVSLSQMTYKLMEASRPVLFKEQEKLQRSKNQLQLITQGILSTKLTELEGFESKLTSMNPTPWIEQGWTQLLNGVKIKDTESLKVGSTLDARLKDASLELKIEKIIRK